MRFFSVSEIVASDSEVKCERGWQGVNLSSLESFVESLSWWCFSSSYWGQVPVGVFIQVYEHRPDELAESFAYDGEAESEVCSESLALEVAFRLNFGLVLME